MSFPVTTDRKIAIIGIGFVGASIAYSLTIKGLAREIIMIERHDRAEKCRAEIDDIRHGISYMSSSSIYCGDYKDIKDCDLIIVSAGRNRRPGETRLEMTSDNRKIASEISDKLRKYYTKGVVIIVTNPVDIITRFMTEQLALPEGRVFGTGCLLDSSRLINVIADHAGLSSDTINAHVIGEHGDGQIVLWSKASIDGIPIDEYCTMSGIPFTEETRALIEFKVRSMGTEIIKGKGKTHYGIATCLCYLADIILSRRSTIVSVSSVLKGEYGINGVALSLPSIVGANGIERLIADKLSDNELSKLEEAAAKLSAAEVL